MFKSTASRSAGFDQWYPAIVAVALAAAVFLVTWVSIRQSRSDSFKLLVEQGKAFTETLALASQNAITAETFYDHLVQTRYSGLVTTLLESDIENLTEQEWVTFTLVHELLGIYIFDAGAEQTVGVVPRGPRPSLPDFVQQEVSLLLGEPESNYVLLAEEDEATGKMVHYYLEVTSSLDMVIVLAVDALYYSEALRQTGIGYLAQNMARETGVEYIIYQSTEGIIFASRKPGELLAIESDPFLTAALDSDSITSRVYSFQDRNVLELVRPFSTTRYPFGLFRVGLALDGYYAVSRGFDQQMIILSGTLFILLLVALLYLGARRKRRELSRRYSSIKSVTDRIFEQMRTGVAVIDGDGVIRVANQALEKIFAVRDIAGRRWAEAMHRHQYLLDEFVAGETGADETELSLESDGLSHTLLVARSRLHDDTDDHAAVVMVVYDITRLKEYERESARKKRLSEMGNLAAGVAHEIRNPLNTISIAAQRLAAEFGPREESEVFLAFTRQIRTETSRLNDIINRFLALAREDQKQRQVVRLDEALRDIGKLLQVEGDKIGLQVSVQAEPDLAIEANPDDLKDLFLNLYNNSREALRGREGSFAIRAARDGDHIRITIEDSGPGIPLESRDKIFAPYYTSKDSGTGLGLSTAQRIVSDLGGEIRLDDRHANGARFIISIPIH